MKHCPTEWIQEYQPFWVTYFDYLVQLGSEGKVDCKLDAKVLAISTGADGKVQVDHNFLRITRQKADEEKKKRKANTIQYLEPQQGGRIIRPLPKTTNFKRKVRFTRLTGTIQYRIVMTQPRHLDAV